MKTILTFGVMAVVLFSVAAGLSLYLNAPKIDESKDATKKKSKEKDADGEADRPIVRAPVTSGADDAAKNAVLYQAQVAGLTEREVKLDARRKQVELVLQDIRSEREELSRVRQQLAAELKLVADKSAELDKKFTSLDEQRKLLAKGSADLSKGRTDYEKDERTNLTKMAALYDGMAPETAAKILQQMADTGKMETAVKVLAQMKPAKASKVLSEMPDAALAAQLLEKMKGLKTTPTPEG